MRKIKMFALVCGALTIGLISCQKETLTDTEDVSIEKEDKIVNNDEANDRTLVTDSNVLNSVKFLDLDVGVVTKGDFHLPDGTVEERIYIGDDITISKDELQALYDVYSSDNGRQYMTANLVRGSHRTIDIIGYTGGSFALSAKARTALVRAVANYNSISNMSLRFNLSFGTNFQTKDIVVYDNSVNTNGSGGRAGFPSSSGRPYKYVQIYNLQNFSTNVNEHVITHEIGHCVGFRHTDWFNRRSCSNTNVNEGVGSVGAIHVSGTPTGRDLTSVMQACFSTSVSGNFNGNDVRGLRSMYPPGSGSICDGVSEWRSGVNYYIGARVTYFGRLYQRVNGGWAYLGNC